MSGTPRRKLVEMTCALLIGFLSFGCAGAHLSNESTGIVRPARQDDLPRIEELAQQKFTQYDRYQPLYYRPARDSADRHLIYLTGKLKEGQQIMLVHETAGRVDGFLMANLVTPPPVYDQMLRTLMIDDFYLADPSLWESAGSTMLAEAERIGKQRGAIQVVAVSGEDDDAKNRFLSSRGLSRTAVWYTRPLVP